jgi:hypothetical protein
MFNLEHASLEDFFLIGSMLMMMFLIAVVMSYFCFKKGQAEKMLLDFTKIAKKEMSKQLSLELAGNRFTDMSNQSLKDYIDFIDQSLHDSNQSRDEADEERAKRFCRQEMSLI